MLRGTGIKLLSLDDAGPSLEVIEDAPDFKGNALKKAREIAAYTKKTALADDSGLEVDALGGSPGVFSARFAGTDATDRDNNKKLLKDLEDISPEARTARFVCVLALVTPDGDEKLFEGIVDGLITFEPEGRSGFGYDPLFVPLGQSRSFAQMNADEKNSMSHRGIALKAFTEFIKNLSN